MPNLHPQIQKVLQVIAEMKLRAIEDMTPEEARAQMEATAASRKAEPLPTARVPLDGLIPAFPNWLKPEAGVLKALVELD